MRWKSSAPYRQLHETEPITGKSAECRVSEWTRYPCSALSVVVNAQADAQRRAEAGVHSIAIHIAVTLSGKPDISTGHYNPTCYLRQSVERRRINVTGLNCTTFLKAHQTKYQTEKNNHLIRCGYGAVCFA